MNPAVIEDGAIIGGVSVEIEFAQKDRPSTKVWSAKFGAQQYTVENLLPSVFGYKQYEGKLENPIEDEDLLKAFDVSLDEAMACVLDLGMEESR